MCMRIPTTTATWVFALARPDPHGRGPVEGQKSHSVFDTWGFVCRQRQSTSSPSLITPFRSLSLPQSTVPTSLRRSMRYQRRDLKSHESRPLLCDYNGQDEDIFYDILTVIRDAEWGTWCVVDLEGIPWPSGNSLPPPSPHDQWAIALSYTSVCPNWAHIGPKSNRVRVGLINCLIITIIAQRYLTIATYGKLQGRCKSSRFMLANHTM